MVGIMNDRQVSFKHPAASRGNPFQVQNIQMRTDNLQGGTGLSPVSLLVIFPDSFAAGFSKYPLPL